MYVYIYERIQCNTKYIIRMVPTAYAPPSKYIREYISTLRIFLLITGIIC